MYSKHVFAMRTQLEIISVIDTTALLKLEITVSALWFSLLVHSGSLKRTYYRSRFVWPTFFLLNVSIALKGYLILYFIRYQMNAMRQAFYSIVVYADYLIHILMNFNGNIRS